MKLIISRRRFTLSLTSFSDSACPNETRDSQTRCSAFLRESPCFFLPILRGLTPKQLTCSVRISFLYRAIFTVKAASDLNSLRKDQ